ncbi:acyl-CoA dehydrogenase family protein [Desulfoferula mesophila]|uniref:Acyl-CoA dehydrogenase n=1 Tax=Desulfoferula mesophila TaxID=3058419 RepID=A0AAU9EGS4_9BACT|nr:acyl-CoA dehydrogenase [Desulfoferula mesophilus]
MEIELNEEQRIIVDSVRKFLAKEISPLVEEYESQSKLITKDIIKMLEPYGYASGLVAEEHGGLGLDFLSYCLMVEELSRTWASLRTMVTSSALVTKLLGRMGSPEQREKFLPPLLAMDELACFALTEPNVGSDTGSLETKAERDGDYYVINGTKTLITGGGLADLVLVYAQVKQPDGRKAITGFLVHKNESPFEARNIRKMGMHCSSLSELAFVDCRVPAANRLGQEGEGQRIALSGLNEGRVNVTFAVVGLGQAALEASIRYAQERVQFGKAIAGFQLVQEMIVEMALKVDTARLLGMRAALMLDSGVDCRREASFAKLYSTEAMVEVCNTAIQVHGGYGYTSEFPVERYFRDVRHLTMAEGTTQIQKLLLGREILGVSAFR